MCFPLAIAAADGSNVGANSPPGSPIGSVSADLLRRVRWANVALAAAVLGTVAIGLWLLLSARSPVLPSDVPRPAAAGYASLASATRPAGGGGDAGAGEVRGGGADATGAGGPRRDDEPGGAHGTAD